MKLAQTEDKKSLASYAELLRRVRETIAAGRERAQDAVEREKVRTSWEIGKLILDHILLNEKRADYGKRVIIRLSRDLGKSETELKYMVEFARTFPIRRTSDELSWSQIETLLAVNDDREREALIQRAENEKWTVNRTRQEVKKLKAAKQITVSEASREEPLIPLKGKLDTYRIITAKSGPWAGKLALDLGFANYLTLDSEQAKKFKDRDIVEITSSARRKTAGLLAMTVAKLATEADLFTYRAYLLQVTDGDTLWVLIDLGFGFVTQQQLRLRGLDASEIASRDGQEAKRFVERELKNVPELIIASTQSDKYDRYLADVFYTVNGRERFLNNRLLETGLAGRV